MKLTGKEAETFLAYPQKFAGALIYGQDEGQVRQRVKLLAENWMGRGAEPINRVEFACSQFTGDSDRPMSLADELAAMSLLAGKRVVCVREVDDSLLPQLETALATRAPDNFLLLFAADSLSGSKLRGWAEKHPAIGCIPCYKDEGAALENFIRDHLRAYGLRAPTEVLQFLAQHLSGDRQIILNELEKLSLYLGDEAEQVSIDDVLAAVVDNSDSGLDELTHAVAGGDIARACRLSDKLLLEGTAGVVMVRAMMRYFARLEQVAQLRHEGMNLDSAIEALRPPVFFKQKPLLRAHAARWSSPKIADAITRLQWLELESKRYSDQARTRMAQGWIEIATLAAAQKKAA
jgi:DNA polymerase-3 subunit delta